MLAFDFISAEDAIRDFQYSYAKERIELLPEEVIIKMFSAWAEENRYLPEGRAERYGPFDPKVVPHLMEILDSCHPDSPYNIISLMKSVQSAGTVSVAENLMGAWIYNKLGSILYLTSSKNIAQIRGSANIDLMIDNSNLADFIKPISNRTNRKTKDSSFYKELAGNNMLMLSSYNSIGDLKSNTFNLIVMDELDEAPAEVKNQGDTEELIEGRTMALSMYKILKLSTPSRAETSRINASFYMGDQREYFVPCPHCGEMQIIDLKGKGDKGGLTFAREINPDTGMSVLIQDTVRVICRFCGKNIRESAKPTMLINGEWRATAIPKDPKQRSYRNPGFISPFLSWPRICQRYINTRFGEDILKFKDFTITVKAHAWRSIKKAASWEVLKNRAEDYCLGTVPKGRMENHNGVDVYVGPLLLYAGVDVQLDRLEMMVTGFGPFGEKWIVDYQLFFGDTRDLSSPCYLALHSWVYNHEYKILGNPAYIWLCAIDCGYDPRKSDKRNKDYNGKSHIIYEYVSRRTGKFIAVMGTPDEKSLGILKESRINDSKTTLTKRYMVAVSQLKTAIFDVIEEDSGFDCIHVPQRGLSDSVESPLPDDFYQQICSERYEAHPDNPKVFGWFKIRARNEGLDTLIYTIAASYFHNVKSWDLSMWKTAYINQLENVETNDDWDDEDEY